MKFKTIRGQIFFKSAAGAALAVLVGLVLWKTSMGEPWVNTSYDYLFRFGTRADTNQVILILMDNEACKYFHEDRLQWDRARHARLLDRLADDGCPLVVMDTFFRGPRDPAKDELLAAAIRRQSNIVLMAEQARVTHPKWGGAEPTPPAELFLSAARSNYGVAFFDPDHDLIVRGHWPFPAPQGPYRSLPWVAAQLAGARLSDEPKEQWLRSYGRDSAWTNLSYRFAFDLPTNYFRNRIVFIGAQPRTTVPDGEIDEFRTPYILWDKESVGGVEINLTAFLNLMNRDWLQRPPWWIELSVLVAIGVLLGGGLARMRPVGACVVAAVAALVATLVGVSWSYYTNYWFPWLVIAAGQVPCALAWSLATPTIRRARELATETGIVSRPAARPAEVHAKVETPPPAADGDLPDAPDYELFNPPIGEGAYGKVWLARNAIGQWQALKVVYLARFENNPDPYEREFNGIRRYKPVSDKHPGLLRVDFVSRKRPDYFYYVMELGDPLEPGWEQEPAKYKPRDLVSERSRSPGKRLPVRECVRIGLALTDALDFLHNQGLTHRDIKPQNIIFVNGQPKLADVGLIVDIRPPDEVRTNVGTPGYMPPVPELPGTPQADIFALGMVLYVLATGRNAAFFPEISTTLVENQDPAEFFPLNAVILKACQPDSSQRYASAADMNRALRGAAKALGEEVMAKAPGLPKVS